MLGSTVQSRWELEAFLDMSSADALIFLRASHRVLFLREMWERAQSQAPCNEGAITRFRPASLAL